MRELNSKKDLGPIRVVSALSLGDPNHDKQLTVHVGRHADIIKGMIDHWVNTNYFNDLVTLVTGGLKEAIRSEKSCLILAFYCKSGKHRSVAAAEIVAVLLMHLPQVTVLIDHLSSAEWQTTPGCKGACQACRRRPLDNPECTAKLQEALTAFERIWVLRGGTHLSGTLGLLPLNEAEDEAADAAAANAPAGSDATVPVARPAADAASAGNTGDSATAASTQPSDVAMPPASSAASAAASTQPADVDMTAAPDAAHAAATATTMEVRTAQAGDATVPVAPGMASAADDTMGVVSSASGDATVPVAPKDEMQQDSAAIAAAPTPKAPPASAAAVLGVAPVDATAQRTSSIFGSVHTQSAPTQSHSAPGGRSQGAAKAAGRGRSGARSMAPATPRAADTGRQASQPARSRTPHHQGAPGGGMPQLEFHQFLAGVKTLSVAQVGIVLEACAEQHRQIIGVKNKSVQTTVTGPSAPAAASAAAAGTAAPAVAAPGRKHRGVQACGPEQREVGVGEDLAVPVGLPGAVPSDGDHPLRDHWAALEAADWPWYSAELERRLAQEYQQGNPPLAFVDLRRTNPYTQFIQELRTRKKSWGFWVDQGVRVYVRMLPRHSDAAVPQELKPFDLRKTVLAYSTQSGRWEVLLERGTLDDIEVLDAHWLLCVTIVQPESRRVRALVYKGVQQQQQQWQQAQEQKHVKHTPSFAGTERTHPSEALAAFWNTHETKLQADMKDVVNGHMATLATLSLDAFVPKAGKRICRDQHRHELPALPPVESADTQPAATAGWQCLTWEELQELITAKIPTQRFISPTLLALTGDVVTALVDAPPSPAEEAPFAALLLVLPKLLWPTRALGPRGVKVRGKQRQRIFGEKLRKARAGQWRALYHEAMQCQCEHVYQDDLADAMEDEHSLPLSDQEAKTLLFAVKKGQPGKALRRLDAATQAPPTPASWASAIQKLAPHDHPAVPAGIVDPELWHPADAAWQTAAGKLKDSKALDPGGWSHEAVKAIWRSPGARTKLVRWLGQLMWETDERMLQLLHVHRPVLLSKPGTNAVRPILISTVWHKLVTSAVTLTLRPLLPAGH